MPDKMTETTRVPMTLREHFFEDPFFSSARNDMETFRNQFFKESSNISKRFEENCQSSGSNFANDQSFTMAPFSDSMFSRSWLTPPRWMMPKSFDEHFRNDFVGGNDNNLISHVDEEGKMEISLNTSGYKPEELRVQVAEGAVKVEGKHEEKSQEGNVMVSRQFSKTYSLPQGAKKEEIASNLSQDGVMVITVPKEKKIQEIKGDQEIAVEHKKSSDNTKLKEDSIRKKSDTINRQEDFKRTENMVPFTLRNSFFSDPFFQNTRGDVISSRNDFFKTARESFEKSLGSFKPDMEGVHDDRRHEGFSIKDSTLLKIKEEDDRLEISLDTSGYKPDELKVTVGQSMVSIEGKHEEKSESGKVMVARQFSKSYGLPQGARAEEVVSNLSKDGVLLITVPKAPPTIKEERRSVPIAVQ